MKKNLIIGTLILNASALSASAAPQLRDDCVSQVKGIVLLTSGYAPSELADPGVIAEFQKIEITDVKEISSHPTAGAPSVTSSATVKGEGISGTVRVDATRGGCFVTRVSLRQDKSQ